MRQQRLLCLLVAYALPACSSRGGTNKSSSQSLANCPDVDASACTQPSPSYAKDIAPLFDRDCNTCHASSDAGPWPLTDYQSLRDWSLILQVDIQGCTMPPVDAGTTLSSEERTLILDWLACGAPNN